MLVFSPYGENWQCEEDEKRTLIRYRYSFFSTIHSARLQFITQQFFPISPSISIHQYTCRVSVNRSAHSLPLCQNQNLAAVFGACVFLKLKISEFRQNEDKNLTHFQWKYPTTAKRDEKDKKKLLTDKQTGTCIKSYLIRHFLYYIIFTFFFSKKVFCFFSVRFFLSWWLSVVLWLAKEVKTMADEIIWCVVLWTRAEWRKKIHINYGEEINGAMFLQKGYPKDTSHHVPLIYCCYTPVPKVDGKQSKTWKTLMEARNFLFHKSAIIMCTHFFTWRRKIYISIYHLPNEKRTNWRKYTGWR